MASRSWGMNTQTNKQNTHTAEGAARLSDRKQAVSVAYVLSGVSRKLLVGLRDGFQQLAAQSALGSEISAVLD